MKSIPLLLAAAALMPVEAANYSAQRTTADGVEIVRLADAAHKTEVSIATSIGNIAFEMKVNGKTVLWSPYQTAGELKAKPVHLGIPFLAPWANRIDGDTYWANGKKYQLNAALNNFRYDGNHKPIHGLIVFSPAWKAISVKADGNGAEVTSRLEFWKYPDLMEQFPFAHTIEMTYRLRDGALEVETAIENHAAEAMPVAIGFHPYFTLHDAPRDQWKVHLAANDHLLLSSVLIPTGEKKAVEYKDPQPLEGVQLDDVFSGLKAGPDGRAEFWVQGKSEKISVIYGPKFPVAVVYAPAGRDFICFEPMTGPTNAFNLAHEGKYKDLQTIAPGGKWKESFWVKPSGF
jgi:aldose 1-epimerase